MNISKVDFRRGIKDLVQALQTGGGGSGSALTKSFFNMSDPLLIKFPPIPADGGGSLTGGTHPSVVYFPHSFSGYKYWMLYTPYPDVRDENPVIVASKDGNTWETPNGVINPIAAAPPAPRYNSDTELVMVNSTTLRAYWREYAAGDGSASLLKFKESKDGRSWGATVTCTVEGGRDPMSPCIVVNDRGEWQMWAGEGVPGTASMVRFTSTDGINWTGEQACVTNYDGRAFNWHPMVWTSITGYHCLAAIRNTGKIETAGLMTDLYYGKSKDGINWVFDEQPTFMRGEHNIKSYRVYRSCAVPVGAGKFKLYISGLGRESEQIHVVDAEKIGELASW